MRLLAKMKDTIPYVRDGFPIRCIRRKKTQDGVKNYWDRMRTVSVDGEDKWEFKRTDEDGEVLRMPKEQNNLLGELEYFDRSYVIDRRKPFMEIYQNSDQDFHVMNINEASTESDDDVDVDLSQNRNLYHQAAEQIAEDAVEISSPEDNKILLGVGLLGIMIGSAVVNYLVISGSAEQIASQVGNAVAANMPQGAGAAGTVAFAGKGLKNRVKDYVTG